MDELNISSHHCLRINSHKLIIKLNFWFPDVSDFIEGKSWKFQDFFNFSIRLNKIIKGE